jgi:predicted DCC family thiol-disulfide oxidoreductase YuxK
MPCTLRLLSTQPFLLPVCLPVMEHIILFDGSCRFCSSIVRFIRRRDRYTIFRLVPFQSKEGKVLASASGLAEKDEDTVVYLRNGKYYYRSTAALEILKDLGGFWRIFYIFIVVPRFIRDTLYRFVARHRHILSGLTANGAGNAACPPS